MAALCAVFQSPSNKSCLFYWHKHGMYVLRVFRTHVVICCGTVLSTFHKTAVAKCFSPKLLLSLQFLAFSRNGGAAVCTTPATTAGSATAAAAGNSITALGHHSKAAWCAVTRARDEKRRHAKLGHVCSWEEVAKAYGLTAMATTVQPTSVLTKASVWYEIRVLREKINHVKSYSRTLAFILQTDINQIFQTRYFMSL